MDGIKVLSHGRHLESNFQNIFLIDEYNFATLLDLRGFLAPKTRLDLYPDLIYL